MWFGIVEWVKEKVFFFEQKNKIGPNYFFESGEITTGAMNLFFGCSFSRTFSHLIQSRTLNLKRFFQIQSFNDKLPIGYPL